MSIKIKVKAAEQRIKLNPVSDSEEVKLDKTNPTEKDVVKISGKLDELDESKQDKLSEAQLENINSDHSKYLTQHQDISNLATKAELEDAGKVKTVNGIDPDSAGNIELVIPDPDLSEYTRKEQAEFINARLANVEEYILSITGEPMLAGYYDAENEEAVLVFGYSVDGEEVS